MYYHNNKDLVEYKEDEKEEYRFDVERIEFGGYCESNNETEVELVWKYSEK